MLSATPALSKLTHYDSDGDLRLKRNYHVTTHFDHVPGVSGMCSMEYPAAVQPPSGAIPHFGMMCTTFIACLLSRRRHQEKWWLGGVVLTVGYFTSGKFHKQGNGAQGHNAGVFLATFGVVGTTARCMGSSGATPFNVASIALFFLMGWYDWGMAHQWTAYIAQFKREISGASGKALETSLWIEFVPQHEATEFVHFKKPNATADAFDWPKELADLAPRGARVLRD